MAKFLPTHRQYCLCLAIYRNGSAILASSDTVGDNVPDKIFPCLNGSLRHSGNRVTILGHRGCVARDTTHWAASGDVHESADESAAPRGLSSFQSIVTTGEALTPAVQKHSWRWEFARQPRMMPLTVNLLDLYRPSENLRRRAWFSRLAAFFFDRRFGKMSEGIRAPPSSSTIRLLAGVDLLRKFFAQGSPLPRCAIEAARLDGRFGPGRPTNAKVIWAEARPRSGQSVDSANFKTRSRILARIVFSVVEALEAGARTAANSSWPK